MDAVRRSGRGRSPGADPVTGYHGRPALKASHFDWKVSAYIHLGGLAGAAQLLGALADAAGRPGAENVARNARYLAVGGSLVGAMLLVADLKTPARWYNMLRILRPTSPMSVGSYVLTAFGGFSGLAALAQFAADTGLARRRAALRFARIAGAPAALTGAGMSFYTAGLLAATSTPLWSAEPRWLAVRFAASAMASASAALSLAERLTGQDDMAERLDRVAALAAAVDLAAARHCASAYRRQGVDGALEEAPWHGLDRVADLATLLPALVHALNALDGRTVPSVIANLALVLGGALERHVVMEAGNRSAGRPGDYLRQTFPARDRGSDRT